MKRLFLLLFVFLLMSCSPKVDAPIRGEYREGEVIVKFKEDVPKDRAFQIIKKEGMAVLEAIPTLNTYRLSIPYNMRVEEAIKRLRGYKEVDKAEPNYIRRMER